MALHSGSWTAWNKEDVCQWLELVGMHKYSDVFLQNDIAGDVLDQLGLAELKEIGVLSLGDRIRIHRGLLRLQETYQNPFNCLSDDLICNIFSYLDPLLLPTTVALVCLKWQKVSNMPILWRDIAVETCKKRPENFMAAIVQRASHLRSFSIGTRFCERGCDCSKLCLFRGDGLYRLVERAVSLTSISLPEVDTSLSVALVLAKLTSLRQLRLPHEMFGAYEPELKAKEETMLLLLTTLTCLESIDIQFLSLESSLPHFFLAVSPRLTRLSEDMNFYLREKLHALPVLTNLVELELGQSDRDYSDGMTVEDIDHLGSLTRLTRLFIDPLSKDLPGSFNFLSKLSGLLDLGLGGEFEQTELNKVLQCTGLTRLHLEGEVSLRRFFTSLPNLQDLAITDWSRETGMPESSMGSSSLQRLECVHQGSPSPDVPSLIVSLSSCPALTQVDIFIRHQTEIVSLETFKLLTQLQRLKLNFYGCNADKKNEIATILRCELPMVKVDGMD